MFDFGPMTLPTTPREAARVRMGLASARIRYLETTLRCTLADYRAHIDRADSRRQALKIFPMLRQAWRDKGAALKDFAAIAKES